MSDELQGWVSDPYRRHELRYYSAGNATYLVRDGNVEGRDPVEAFAVVTSANGSKSPIALDNGEAGTASPTPAPPRPHQHLRLLRPAGRAVVPTVRCSPRPAAGTGLDTPPPAWAPPDRVTRPRRLCRVGLATPAPICPMVRI